MTPLDKPQLVEKFRAYAPHVDAALLVKAYDFSVQAHGDQARASGEDYFIHCRWVATSLVDWKMDLPTVCAGVTPVQKVPRSHTPPSYCVL